MPRKKTDYRAGFSDLFVEMRVASIVITEQVYKCYDRGKVDEAEMWIRVLDCFDRMRLTVAGSPPSGKLN